MSLHISLLTFNCARHRIDPSRLAAHLSEHLLPPSSSPASSPPPELLVLSLQEVAPLAYAFLGGTYFLGASYLQDYYLAAVQEAVRIFSAEQQKKKEDGWGYELVVSTNVGMVALMVFVRRDRRDAVRWIETAGTGLGVWEMGNKGAVGVRIGYAETDGDDEGVVAMTFVGAHLAPMEDGLERRNRDWMNIVKRLVFVPIDGTRTSLLDDSSPGDTLQETSPLLPQPKPPLRTPTGLYHPRTHVFLAGDLNYRTHLTSPTPDDASTFTDLTDVEYYSKLLGHDQLAQERQAGRTCHGFREPPIRFPPTYKYAKDSLEFATHRWPSWCDRICYLDFPVWSSPFPSPSSSPSSPSPSQSKIQIQKYTTLPHHPTSDHLPVILSLSLPSTPIPPPPPPPSTPQTAEDPRLRPPFAMDPHWRARRRMARVAEIVVGVVAYLGGTWEGWGVLAVGVGTVLVLWGVGGLGW
ncbi:MAG: hypothetical protein M1817_000839 [Caeruleum heppii]|nr:MAG: hypothetical protein M1817_000839 [Caeruleum heppii]